MTASVDERAVEDFMHRVIGYVTGSAVCYGIWLGDELGLYRVLAGTGPASADDLAARSGCNPRLVREWLDGQTAAGLIERDAAADTYAMSDARDHGTSR